MIRSIKKQKFSSIFICSLVIPASQLLLGCGGSGGGSGNSSRQLFEVVIENTARPNTLVGPSGQPVPVVFSPFLFAVHSLSQPIYAQGQAGPVNGLELMAEEGDPTGLINTLQLASGVSLIGIAQTPVGEMDPSVLLPGSSYKTVIRADVGDRISLISSFIQGNDLFIGTADSGIPLFDSAGTPLSGEVTQQLALLDAGTEVNERPGFGPNQSPRQPMVGAGTVETNPVGPVADSFTYPAVSGMIKITINPI